MNEAIEEAQVLAEDWLIQMVFGAEVAFNFRRSRFAFAIKRPARHDADHDKGQEADEQQQRRHEKNAFQEIHSTYLTTELHFAREPGIRKVPICNSDRRG